MEITRSCVVRCTAGREKGRLFMVVGIEEGGYALLADGRSRKLENPKKKKFKHVSYHAQSDPRIREKLLEGEHITNAALRRMLSDMEERREET